jgi:hypothetical protein
MQPENGKIYHARSDRDDPDEYVMKYVKGGKSWYIWLNSHSYGDGIRPDLDRSEHYTSLIETEFTLSEPQPWEVELLEASVKAGHFVKPSLHFSDDYQIF